jgi:hypothetical protein
MPDFRQAISALQDYERHAIEQLTSALQDPHAPLPVHQNLLTTVHEFRGAIRLLQDAMKSDGNAVKVDESSLEDAIRNSLQQPS